MNEEQEKKGSAISGMRAALTVFAKLPLPVKTTIIGAGVGFFLVLIIIILFCVSLGNVIEFFQPDTTKIEGKIGQAHQELRERVDRVATQIKKDTGVEIDKYLLVSTLVYDEDIDTMSDSSLMENIEGSLSDEGGQNWLVTLGQTLLDKITNVTDTYLGTAFTKKGKELRRWRKSERTIYAVAIQMVNENKLDLPFYKENLIKNIIPRYYYDYVPEKNKDATIKEIATEIFSKADLYKFLWADEKNKNNNNCIVSGDTQARMFLEMTPEEYISYMGPIAQADYSRTGILASVTLAQSILESGWGKSKLSVEANNMFGMKGSLSGSSWPNSTWDGVSLYNIDTGEQTSSGDRYTVNANFRKYPSVEASVGDHSAYLVGAPVDNGLRYAGITDTTNYTEQTKIIKNGGYATDVNYVSLIVELIQERNLDKWDVTTNVSSSNLVCNGSESQVSGWTVRTIVPTKSDSAFDFSMSNVGQCVWYAQGRAIEIVQELAKKNKISSDKMENIKRLLLSGYGNAEGWFEGTTGIFKHETDIKKPKAGSFAVWGGGSTACTKPCGHISVIEEVNDANKTITFTEGWANGGSSCPGTGSCVSFQNKTMSFDEFYEYAKNNGGIHNGTMFFKGYVSFLEPES